ncbi:MAG: hypothetical protein ACI4GD_12620 [Lachnospiraceae bacterium]
MLKLKNIKKNNNIISAEYDPESSGELGSISIDIDSGKVVDSQASKLDSPLPMYLKHAEDALKKIMMEDDIPKEKIIMWY